MTPTTNRPMTRPPMRERHQLVRVVVKLLVPIVFLFALYVQAHGDFGPGGGFQAGVLFAVGFIAFTLVFGLARTIEVVPPEVLHRLMAVGVLLYGGVGVVNLLAGDHYLDYRGMAHDPAHGIHLGILLVELGVGITVASVMSSIFFGFAARTGSPAEQMSLPESGIERPGLDPEHDEHKDPPVKH